MAWQWGQKVLFHETKGPPEVWAGGQWPRPVGLRPVLGSQPEEVTVPQFSGRKMAAERLPSNPFSVI